MKLVYTPDGSDKPKSWDVDLRKLMSPEAELIERQTGWDYGTEFVDRLASSSMLAIRALLFVLLKRGEPTMKWDQLQFSLSEISLEPSDDEKRAALDMLNAKPADELTKSERASKAALEADVEPPKDEVSSSIAA